MTTATGTQPTKHTNDCVRQRAKFGARSEAGDVCSCGGMTTETESAITLSNFRVTYQPPRYEDGRVLYDGYCAILADDAEFDGRTVRVFDVPDADEGQRAVAQFACEAMNQHARLLEALQDLTATAATLDNKLHAGFKVSQLSTEQSQMYNAINSAKTAIYEAERIRQEREQ